MSKFCRRLLFRFTLFFQLVFFVASESGEADISKRIEECSTQQRNIQCAAIDPKPFKRQLPRRTVLIRVTCDFFSPKKDWQSRAFLSGKTRDLSKRRSLDFPEFAGFISEMSPKIGGQIDYSAMRMYEIKTTD